MKVQNLKNSKTKKITNKSAFFSSDRREVHNNQIKILLSAEHRNYVEDIEKCFDDLNIKIEAGYVRKSIEELPMQVLIFLTGAITTGITWDLIKIGIKKVRKKFKKVGIRITGKNQNVYNINLRGQINVFLVSNGKTKVISNITSIDDLFKHLQKQNSGWQKIRLGNVIKSNQQSIGKNYSYKTIKYLDTGSITRGKIEGLQTFNLPDAPSRAKRLVKDKNIIYSNVRPIQRHYGFIKNPINNFVVSTGFSVIEVDELQANPFFIYKILTSNDIVEELDTIAEGATTAYPSLKPSDIENLEISLPPLPEQEAIAEVLSSLDDKIELLHKQNKILEDIAQTLFRKWFMEDAKDDWDEGFIPDEFNFTMGLSPPGNSYNEAKEGLPMFQGNADFGFRFPQNRIYTINPKRVAEPFNTLISVRAPVGEQNMALEKCCIGRGVSAFKYKNNETFYAYTYYKIKSLINEIRQFNQIGTVFGSINKQDFNSFPINIPPVNAVKNFQNIVKPVDDKVILNCIQIRKLEKLRTTLLSKLMSGKVKVK